MNVGVARLMLACVVRRLLSHRLVAWAGLVVVVSTLLTWTTLLWAGWTLVFSTSPGAIVESATGHPAEVVERVYFVGYTIFTLGLGDYRPQGSAWELATSLAAGSGFLLFGLALAYLVPVTAAATQNRAIR